MTQYVISNNVNTTLAAALASGSTTISLASSANLPTLAAGQIMPITLNDAATGLNYEICYVTAISGTTLTVTRGQEGTSALNWSVGDYAYCAFTAGTAATSFGNPNNTFQVAAAAAPNMAPQTGQIQSGATTYAIDTGSANTYQVAYSPAITSVSDGMRLRFKTKTANTGASTFAPNAVASAPIWGAAHSALQGGEIIANSDVEVVWNSSLNTTGAWVLLASTGGAEQIAPATQSNHAVNRGQFASSQAGNGYQKLPGGLIIQWGSVTTSASNDVGVTFPIAFPNNAFSVTLGNVTGSGGFFNGFNTLTQSGFQAASWVNNTTRGSTVVNWMAIGN